MRAVNMLEAKSSLSRLVEVIELGQEREIVIARNGRPAARLVPIVTSPAEKRSRARASVLLPPLSPLLHVTFTRHSQHCSFGLLHYCL